MSMTIIHYVEILMACALGIGLGRVMIPQIFLLSFRFRLFDCIDPRKIHEKVTPRLGGIAFFPCIVGAVSFVAVFHNLVTGATLFKVGSSVNLLSLFAGLFVVYLIGLTDDLVGVRYRTKLLAQTLCGVLLAASGCYLNNLYGLFGINELPQWIGMPLTVFVCVYLMNAFNFIDGLDGLASGLSIMAFATLGYMFVLLHWWIHAYITSAAIGVLTLFFYFNVFGESHRRRKIFMGDAGSLTIGLLLSALLVRLGMSHPDKDLLLPDAFFIAFSFLIVPVFDVARVVLHRLRTGKNPFLPDKNHIHHKFIALGCSRNTAMLLILGIALAFALFNICLIHYLSVTLLFGIDVLLWTLMHMLLSRKTCQCVKTLMDHTGRMKPLLKK